MISLAAQLFREVNPGFFRVLAGKSAAVYLDVLDGLEREASERHEGMSREEALAIVSEVLAQHPAFAPDEGEIDSVAWDQFAGLPLREKARLRGFGCKVRIMRSFVCSCWLTLR